MCEFLSAVWDSCKEHGSDIVCSIIETTGVIVAARIGVGGLKKIAKDRFDTYFTSFSSKNHDLERILNRAESLLSMETICWKHINHCLRIAWNKMSKSIS